MCVGGGGGGGVGMGGGTTWRGGGGGGGEGAWCSSPFTFFLKGYVIEAVHKIKTHSFWFQGLEPG